MQVTDSQTTREREFWLGYERCKEKPPVIVRYKPMPTPMDYRKVEVVA